MLDGSFVERYYLMQRRRQRVVGGGKKKKRGKDGNKKEEPSSCPQLLNSTTFTKSSRPKQLKMLSAINLFASLSLYHLPFEKDDYSRMV